jgi:hypothetical protein
MKLSLVVNVAKIAAATVSANGARKIIAGIVENNVTVGKPKDKIAVVAATWVLSGIVATACKKYTDNSIDSAVSKAKGYFETMELKNALARINKGESTFEQENLVEADFTKVNGLWTKAEKEEPVVEAL